MIRGLRQIAFAAAVALASFAFVAMTSSPVDAETLVKDPSAMEAQQRQQAPQRAPEVVVINRTNATLQNLFMVALDETNWGQDRLGSDTVAAGQRYTARLDAGNCRYDMRAVYQNGGEETRFGLDICRTREITLTNQSRAAGSAAPPRRQDVAFYLIRNRTGDTIASVFTNPSGAQNQDDEEDVLGASVLEDGQTFTGRVERDPTCLYDLRTTGTNEERRERVNLCTVGEIVFGAEAAQGQSAGQRPGQPAGERVTTEIRIVNGGAVTIQVINVRPAGARSWGEDRLGADVLPAGRTLNVSLARAANECAFDIRVTYDRGGEEVRERQDVCQQQEFSFSRAEGARAAGRGRPKTQTGGNQGRPGPVEISLVTIVNSGQSPIEQVNISSSNVSEWGDNRLAAQQVIAPGARETLRIERDGQCNFDLMVVFRGGREERRMRQNICQPRDFAFDGSRLPTVDGGGPPDGRAFTFVNDGRAEIRELYATPTSDTHWGDDLLGRDTLPRRARLELRLPRNECRYDLRLVYADSRAEEQRDIDLCATDRMNIGRRTPTGVRVSTGTGFFVSSAGHVLTNHHVIESCSTVAYTRPNGQRVTLTVLAEDSENDLALLQETGSTAPAMPFRSRNAGVRAGERVVLVGYPVRDQLGGVNVTEGLVSALRGPRGDASKFQYTAPTQPGNSGGPVIDEHGLVVGVVVAQFDKLPGDRTAQNINFGVNLDTARRFLESRNVPVADEQPGDVRRTVDILERAMPSVLPLDCLG